MKENFKSINLEKGQLDVKVSWYPDENGWNFLCLIDSPENTDYEYQVSNRRVTLDDISDAINYLKDSGCELSASQKRMQAIEKFIETKRNELCPTQSSQDAYYGI